MSVSGGSGVGEEPIVADLEELGTFECIIDGGASSNRFMRDKGKG